MEGAEQGQNRGRTRAVTRQAEHGRPGCPAGKGSGRLDGPRTRIQGFTSGFFQVGVGGWEERLDSSSLPAQCQEGVARVSKDPHTREERSHPILPRTSAEKRDRRLGGFLPVAEAVDYSHTYEYISGC